MAKPGPKNKPAEVHYLHGNPGGRDHGGQMDTVVACEVPQCPSFLSDDAKTHWKYISAELKKYGLISKLDRAALAGYCSAYATFKKAEERIQELDLIAETDDKLESGLISKTPQGYLQVSAWWVVRNNALMQLLKIGEQFGLTPSARARVQVKDPNQGTLDLD